MAHPVYYPVEDDTLVVFFDSYDGSTGASITMSGFVVGDIKIYKDGSINQRSSTVGFTLLDTDGTNFDGITGLHGFSIDLSDDTDVGFFTVGPWYHIVVNAVTIDTRTVNFIAAAFRILSTTRGMAGTAVPDAVSNAAGGLLVSTAGSLNMDAMNTNINDIETDTGTTLDGKINTIDTVVDAIKLETDKLTLVNAGVGVAGSIIEEIEDIAPLVTTVDTVVDAIKLETDKLTLASAGAGVAGSIIEEIEDIIPVINALNNISTAQVNTQCDLALTDLNLDHLLAVAAVDGDVINDSIIAQLSSLGTPASFPSFSNLTDSLEAIRDNQGGAAPSAAVIADAVWDEAKAGHVGATTFGDLATDLNTALTNIADVPTVAEFNARTILTADYFDPAADAVANVTLCATTTANTDMITAATVNAQCDLALTDINLDHLMKVAAVDADVTNDSIIALLAASGTPANFTTFDNINDSLQAISESGGGGPTAAAIADAVWDEPKAGHVGVTTFGDLATDLDSALADTNELQIDWVNGGRLDLLLDAIPTTAMRGTDSAALASVCTEARLAELDAANLPTDIANLNDISQAQVLTQINAAIDTAIAEIAVGIPTATPTLRTGLMLMYMALRNRTDVDTSGVDELQLHNDAGVIICKKTLTDDGSDYSEAEMTSG